MAQSSADSSQRPATPEPTSVDALAQTSFVLQSTLERLAGERGFSLIQTRLLGVLRDRQPTAGELARLLDLDKSSVSGLLDRAERRGLVRRTPSQTDRRSVRVSLTDEGRALISEVGTEFEAEVATLLTPLDQSEQATLTALLSRVIVAYAKAHGVDLSAAAAAPAEPTAPAAGAG
jgi:MarR family transcriptional regulator, lower aerobic nicotinate degradation pathway regulator